MSIHPLPHLFLLLAWVLAACSGEGAGTVTPAEVTSTASPTTVVSTSRPTLTPRPTVTPVPTVSEGEYRNPVLDRDFPDPDILQVEDVYYAYATNSEGANIPVARSEDLVSWEIVGDALLAWPAWAPSSDGYIWAPEVTRPANGQGYVLYLTAHFARGLGGVQCIGVTVADEPTGPFEHVGDEPLICPTSQGGAIDAASFIDADGTPYILWKNDGNSQGGQSFIWIQQVSEDGLTLLGEPTKLITADRRWEGVLVEGPTLWLHDGKYYLFYSANDYTSPRYAVGYAVADHVLGPYTKPENEPFLATSIPGGIVGPGGQDLVTGPDGGTWMVFHAWTPQSYRNLNLVRVEWQNGEPEHDPLTRQPQDAP